MFQFRRIGRATATVARLTKRVWENKKLTTKTKIAVYSACVLSTLLNGSETLTLYAWQEKMLNTFDLRTLRRILGVRWSDRITNNEILERADIPSMCTLLRKHRLRWLGHVRRMDDGRIPKDLRCGELAIGKRTQGRPQLHYKDICKKYMRAIDIDIEKW